MYVLYGSKRTQQFITMFVQQCFAKTPVQSGGCAASPPTFACLFWEECSFEVPNRELAVLTPQV